MRHWLLKTAVQHLISLLPHSHRWNEFLQRYVTKGLELRANEFHTKLECCRRHLEYYLEFSSRSPGSFIVLEIGTGCFPVVPIGLYLCGAGDIHTYDIVPVLRDFTLRRTLERFLEFESDGTLGRVLPWVRPDRLDRLRRIAAAAGSQPPAALLEALNVHARIGDARQSGLPDGSVDFVFSTFVLEHIPGQVITELLVEFKRVFAPGAVMSHYVGLADQYASFDSSITPFNFLRYPASRWRYLNNRMIPLTRLRISDYRALLKEGGYAVVKEDSVKGSIADLRRIRLAPEFRGYAEADLLVLYSWLVARRAMPDVRAITG